MPDAEGVVVDVRPRELGELGLRLGEGGGY